MNLNKYYAGIGSRETPLNILQKMHDLAGHYCSLGMVLRSGGAKGADSAFESGITSNRSTSTKEIFRAKDCTVEAVALSGKFHPNWDACNDYVKQLHGRNAMILLGANLKTPIEFIVCWTPNGAVTGGTGQALRMAKEYDIPVYNLALIDLPTFGENNVAVSLG